MARVHVSISVDEGGGVHQLLEEFYVTADQDRPGFPIRPSQHRMNDLQLAKTIVGLIEDRFEVEDNDEDHRETKS